MSSSYTKFWQTILLRLLYLTPFGYFLSTISLLLGERTPGIHIALESYSPIRATVKKKPSLNERVNWFINGVFLLAEGWFILVKEITGNIGGTFALFAFIFGLTSIIAAFFPSISLNKRIF